MVFLGCPESYFAGCPDCSDSEVMQDLASAMRAACLATSGSRATTRAGFTLVETIVATFVAAIVLLTFYGSLAAGFSVLKLTREDLRATQIILQRMEAIRLSAFNTLQNPAEYPVTFTEYYSESGKTNGSGGAAYTISYKCGPPQPGLPPSYRADMLQITVQASWNSGGVQRTRSMQTYVSKYGIQRYVSRS